MGDLFDADDPASARERRRPPDAPSPIVVPDQRSVINLASGVVWERLTPERDPAVEFLQVTYDVGSESCPADSLVTHGGREYAYVISGRLGVRIDFDEYCVEPGCSITFDASSPHRLWAIGDEPVVAIWVVVGRQRDSRTHGLTPKGLSRFGSTWLDLL